jgi:hypothetical protein
MSKSYWLSISIMAIAGCLAAGPALAVPPIARQQNNPEVGASSPKQEQSEAANREFIAALHAIKNALNDLVSQELGSDEFMMKAAAERHRNEADLNAQKSMAWWAMWMFIAAAFQIVINVFGVILLFKNLKLVQESNANANQATHAAIDAAKAAQKSADIQEESFRRLERPYLFVRPTDTSFLRLGHQRLPDLCYTLVNYGQMPAILRSISVRLEENPQFPLRIPMHKAEEFFEVIAPGQQMANERRVVVENSKLSDSYAGQRATLLVMHGRILYEDPTGALHTEHFAMRGNPGGHTFKIDGGSEYNWRKTEYPPYSKISTANSVVAPDSR